MMEVVHIYHSGFYIELAQCALLFDYYKGTLPAVSYDKPLYVFVSHVHQDHFSFSIFTHKELRGHPRVLYVLSNDIKRKYNRNFFLRQGVTQEQYERITFVKAGETVCIGDVQIRTLKSTDAGAAFIVNAEGRLMYHAGDLNWWSG